MLYKIIGCVVGVLSGGAAGYYIPNRYSKTPTIGETSALYTTDLQWKFLYNLSLKIFNYLSNKSKVDNKNNLIDWLQHKFKKNTKFDEWKAFKYLCTQQLKLENNPSVNGISTTPEVRLCFMGEKLETSQNFDPRNSETISNLIFSKDKGNLKNWKGNGFDGLIFKSSWTKSNYDLWAGFKKQNENLTIHNLEVQFEKWFKQEKTKNQTLPDLLK